MTDKEYNQLLRFVYHEGYADSYEEAEYLLEEVSDSDFEAIYDEFSSVQTSKVVCDYLVSEGFAPDAESASSILGVMSDQWLDQIMEMEIRDMTPAKLKQFNATIKDKENNPHKYHNNSLNLVTKYPPNVSLVGRPSQTEIKKNTPKAEDTPAAQKRRQVRASLRNVPIL
jgi:hypothetical protein